jgi:hypothetical protein
MAMPTALEASSKCPVYCRLQRPWADATRVVRGKRKALWLESAMDGTGAIAEPMADVT